MGKFRRFAVLFVVLHISLAAVDAQEAKPPRPDLTKLFAKQDVMIPMRDGVKLHTEIYTPKDGQG
ncbi:MAG TPA: hypothetical protein VII25_11890, partial [Candidatus Acidoferrum sp.]